MPLIATPVQKMKKCMTCGGTGRQWINRSWFGSDGYKTLKCGICAGTGFSSAKGDTKFAAQQKKRRAALEAARAGG